MRVDWSPLRTTLRDFRRDGLDLPLWWRDDDATEPTAALDRLYDTAERLDVPVHVAVIPGRAKPGLSAMTASSGLMIPIAHGWQHWNHAPPHLKRSEFGTPRPDAAEEIGAAFAAMKAIFGTGFLPLFVPPWNRLDPSHVGALREAGFRGVSTFPSKQILGPTPGLHQIRTHVDPIDWHGDGGLLPTEAVIARTVYRLQARRYGLSPAHEPFGLLTHHLVQNEETWQFFERILRELLDGGARLQVLRPLLENDP